MKAATEISISHFPEPVLSRNGAWVEERRHVVAEILRRRAIHAA